MDHADEDDTSPVLGRSGLVNDAGATQNEVGTDGVHCRAQAMVQDATRRRRCADCEGGGRSSDVPPSMVPLPMLGLALSAAQEVGAF